MMQFALYVAGVAFITAISSIVTFELAWYIVRTKL
jgi:hypothetical protein